MALSATQLERMRETAEGFLPDTCTLQTVTRTRDASGGWADAWSDTHTNVPCRLAPVQSRRGEALTGEALAATTAWVLTAAYDQALDATMRVVHGGRTYEIAQVDDLHSWRSVRRAELRRID